MWRLFNAICMLSVVALLGLHGGQARSLLLHLNLDGASCSRLDRGALGVSGKSSAALTSAGAASNWVAPAEIETRALIWLPPREIAPTLTVVVPASTVLPGHGWAPPAEIAAKSTFAVQARAWRPPVEIAPAKITNLDVGSVGDIAVVASTSDWALPTEVAAKAPAIEHRSSLTGGTRDWLPPAEIAPMIATANGVDAVITGLAARALPDRPRSSWAPPAEIAKLLPTPLGSVITNSDLVWRPPAECQTPSKRAVPSPCLDAGRLDNAPSPAHG